MLVIRRALLSDFEKLQQLSQKLFLYEKKYGDIYDENWPYHNSGKEYLSRRLVNDNSIVLLAEQDGVAVGYLLGHIGTNDASKLNPIAELENIYIDESARRQGVGNQLIQEFKRMAVSRGSRRLKVTCYQKNIEAINFYRKHGFDDATVTLEQMLK